MIDINVLVAIIVLGGSVTVAALGWIKDSSAAKRIREELAHLEKRDERRDGLIIALRHYVTVLMSWGAHSTDTPPRQAPEPPAVLTRSLDDSDD